MYPTATGSRTLQVPQSGQEQTKHYQMTHVGSTMEKKKTSERIQKSKWQSSTSQSKLFG